MSLEYLEEGFEPKSLKVADLRRILIENKIDFSLNAKKNALLRLYSSELEPLLPELRERFANVKPSDEGIEDAVENESYSRKRDRDTLANEEESSSNGESDEDEDEDSGTKIHDKIREARRLSISSDSSESSSDASIENYIKEPTTPEVKKRKKDLESKGTPIVDKVQKKSSQSPSKPSTSFTLESFDVSMSDDSSDDSGFNLYNKKKDKSENDDQVGFNTEATPTIFDFSYNGKNISPDLSKLKVSSGFAEQLQNAIKANDDKKNTSGLDLNINDSASFSSNHDYDEIKLSSLDDNVNKPEFNFNSNSSVNASNVRQSDGYDQDDIEIHTESNDTPILQDREVDNIHTPDLLTIKDVTDSDVRVSSIESQIQQDKNEIDTPSDLVYHIDDSNDSNEEPEIEEVSDDEDMADENNESNEENPIDVSDIEVDNNDKEQVEKEPKHDSSVTPAKRTFKKKLFRFIRKLLFLFVLCILFAAPTMLGLWYREQRILVGYCGNEIPFQGFQQFYPAMEILKDVDAFLEDYEPECIPCPENAICYPYMKMRCQAGYALQKSKYSLFGLIPINDSCTKDDRRDQLVKEVVKKSLEFLRTKNAEISCGEGNDDVVSGMSEEDLYNIFSEARAPWINDEDYDKIWEQAVDDLKNEPEIIWRQVSISAFFNKNYNSNYTNKIKQLLKSGTNISFDTYVPISSNEVQGETRHIQQTRGNETTGYLRSTSKKYIGLRCKFEGEIYQTYKRYQYPIWVISIALVIVKYFEYRLKKYFKEKALVIKLVEKTTEKLKQVKDNTPSYLSTVQLRDILLFDVTNLKRRNIIWGQVVKKLEANNTNIKSSLLEVHGEIMRCWEWIGPIDGDLEKRNDTK